MITTFAFVERFTVWQCYFSTSTCSYTLLSAMFFAWGFLRQYHLFIFTISLLLYHIFISVTYLPFSVPLARVITPVCMPYIHSSVHFHLLVVFVVLANNPLYNFLYVFSFSLCVNLFHFIDFLYFYVSFFFSCNQTFIDTFFHALC